ncbi:zinc-binding alcohol dehydrogenase [Paenibacillaceae bacterium WGS1546]|uniref:zinc-dependent alcohol dehydrogenase n=1 Tax=Cohnella sp. WGS1546 TaxID=3366810 RepID=UPI00372D6C9B
MKVSVYEAPKTLTVAEVPDLPLAPDEIRIETMYSGISHGTEMNVYRGYAPFFKKEYDPSTRLFVEPREEKTWQYPIRSCDEGVWYLGYSSVGKVVEKGPLAEGVDIGDIVYTDGPHQSQVIRKPEQAFKVPQGVHPKNAIVFTNLITAFNGILDARIKLGDIVVVMGLGVVGQLVAQMAKLSGGIVVGVDTIDKRRQAALDNGADAVFSPLDTDVAKEVRAMSSNRGADVVIDVTGSYHALNEAIRIIAPERTIIAMSWYPNESRLALSEEFHHNRVTIKCSQTNYTAPEFAQIWPIERKREWCLQLLPKLKLDNILTTTFPFAQINEAFATVDRHPENIIQCILDYSS